MKKEKTSLSRQKQKEKRKSMLQAILYNMMIIMFFVIFASMAIIAFSSILKFFEVENVELWSGILTFFTLLLLLIAPYIIRKKTGKVKYGVAEIDTAAAIEKATSFYPQLSRQEIEDIVNCVDTQLERFEFHIQHLHEAIHKVWDSKVRWLNGCPKERYVYVIDGVLEEGLNDWIEIKMSNGNKGLEATEREIAHIRKMKENLLKTLIS